MTVPATVSASTRVAAVIGHPVRHSLSPAIHNAAFAAAGLDWVFTAFEVAEGRGADAVAAMRTLRLGGLAVTTPHKATVAAAVDEVDPAAAALRSVNTVVLRDDGSTFGASTDGAGFVESLRAAGHDPCGARVVVVGAGAAARSVIDALGRAGADDIAVVNRTESAAIDAAALSARAHVAATDAIPAAHYVVNATTIGMGTIGMGSTQPGDVAFDPSLLCPAHVVADLVYHPLETPLLRLARDAGAAVVDGLGMLVHQAVLQQELWTGVRPDPAVLRAAAESELSA